MGSSQGLLTIRETLDTEENQEVQDLLNLPSRKEDVVSEGIEETHDLTALIMMGKHGKLPQLERPGICVHRGMHCFPTWNPQAALCPHACWKT